MGKAFRHTLLWLVSISILNTSIDFSDEAYISSPESYSEIGQDYDEIESIAELVMDNTMDESLPDQKGNEQSGLIKKASSFDFYMPEKKTRLINSLFLVNATNKLSAHYNGNLSAGYLTILTPPPNFQS